MPLRHDAADICPPRAWLWPRGTPCMDLSSAWKVGKGWDTAGTSWKWGMLWVWLTDLVNKLS